MEPSEAYADRYRVQNGLIRNPGKFEGEPLYVPYFYDFYLEGGGEAEEEDGGYRITIEAQDIQAFPALAGFTTICLYEDDAGFVYHRLT